MRFKGSGALIDEELVEVICWAAAKTAHVEAPLHAQDEHRATACGATGDELCIGVHARDVRALGSIRVAVGDREDGDVAVMGAREELSAIA